MIGRLNGRYPISGNPMSLDPNRLILTDENPFIRLSDTDGGAITTNASFWRILISPAGAGHVLYLKSDLTQGRWKIYSDNIAIVRWLQKIDQRMLNNELSDTSIPVTDAALDKTGDARDFWTERAVSHDAEVAPTWYDIGKPLNSVDVLSTSAAKCLTLVLRHLGLVMRSFAAEGEHPTGLAAIP
jgi:hypothetical protein